MTVPPQAEGTPPNWGCYVTVSDVDATAAKAEELGGKILMPPTDIPNVGRFSVLQDPQGAVISEITYAENE
jgi:predicted enzyme related to lactoylglutathione lyase